MSPARRVVIGLLLATAAVAEDASRLSPPPWRGEEIYLRNHREFAAERLQNNAGQYDYFDAQGEFIGSLVPNYHGGYSRYDSTGAYLGEYVYDYSGNILLFDLNGTWRIMDNPHVDAFTRNTASPGLDRILPTALGQDPLPGLRGSQAKQAAGTRAQHLSER